MYRTARERNSRHRIHTGLFLVALMLGSGCLSATDEIVGQPEPSVVTASVTIEGSPISASDLIIANAVIEEGTAPFIANWRLDGVLVQTSNSLAYDAGFLSVGTHTIEVELTDSMGASTVSTVIFTLLEPNRAPTVSLELPSVGIAGIPIAWSVDAADPDGDNLVVEVDFSDGVTLRDLSGQHIWGEPGTYSVRVSATDSSGFLATAQESIRIDDANAPLLTVSTNPSPQGRIHLNLAGELSIATVVEDPLGSTSVSIDWGDDSTSDPALAEESHQYSEEGIYVVRVTATGPTGITTERVFHVEVVSVVDDLEAAQLQDELEDEAEGQLENEVEQGLDPDGDGTVDEVTEAQGDSEYDWQSDFDPDGDGYYDDDQEVDDWVTTDEESVRDEVGDEEATDTIPSDSLMIESSVVNEGEGPSEDELTPIPFYNEADIEIVNPVFNEAWGDVDDASMQEQTYLRSISQVTATWWNDSFWEDWDNDGVPETLCHRTIGVFWFDSDGIPGPERIILVRTTHCSQDRDGDGNDDLFFTRFRGLDLVDQNSDGIPERHDVLTRTVWTWDNGTYEDVNIHLFAHARTDADQDGNLERRVVVNRDQRMVDQGIGSVLTAYFSHSRFILRVDNNDDGTPERWMTIDHTSWIWDPTEDGNADRHRDNLRAVVKRDTDSDGSVDVVRALQQNTVQFDNDSNGVVELQWTWRAGVLKVDTDHDGDLDYTARMRGWHQHWDWGMIEYHIHRFALTRTIDHDADGILEWKQRTIHMSNATDWDFDRHLEQRESYTATLTWWDSNEDGYEEHIFRRVREASYLDEHAHGWTSQTEETRSMEIWRDSNHNLHAKRVVVIGLSSWDNNSDGSPDTYDHLSRTWQGSDTNNDDFLNRRVFHRHHMMQRDDNADGNVTFSINSNIWHARNLSLSSSGNIEVLQEAYLSHNVLEWNINSLGHAYHTNSTWIGFQIDYVTGTSQGITVTVITVDSNQDGTPESQTITTAGSGNPP
ncbi:MAG TPA: hypothetical protein EYQ15_03925 [Candidatus Poseidoniales archaeon]|nr:hypothetical protein [Candidatus Poseidoniales archaeon]HIL43664.1 hypothetical protein [Candidatus Poseidoniales archaeon]